MIEFPELDRLVTWATAYIRPLGPPTPGVIPSTLAADLAAVVARDAALRAIVSRLTRALEQHLPPDPHCGAGGGHICDAECEEMFHLGELLSDARRALSGTGQ